MITIEDQKLVSTPDGPEISFEESPNQSGIFKDGLPDTIIIHYTAGSSMASSVNWLKNPKAKASAHLVIGKSGKIVQLAPFNTITWHAGRSKWNKRRGLNKYSIGIELDNAGALEKRADGYYTHFGEPVGDDRVVLARHKHEQQESAWEAYTEVQLRVVTEVCMVLREQYNIKELLGHDDISPKRKRDPGPAFPLEQFREKVLLGRRAAQESQVDTEVSGGIVLAEYLNIRSRPGIHSIRVSEPLPKGTTLKIVEQKGQWSYVKAEIEGWVNTKWLKTF
ncbi:MAG: N-acetylmuramoyl-L-alanine amidase [Bacteroidota bacterium]